MSPAVPRKILPGISGFRALACLSVIFYHAHQSRSTFSLSELDWSLYLFVETFPIAVSFFFVLGGAFRSLPYWRAIFERQPKPDPVHAIVDRMFRIAPAFYAALLVSFVFGLIYLWRVPHDIVRLLGGITFTSWLHPSLFFPTEINGPLWYIAYDTMGSIMIILLMSFLEHMPKRWIPFALAMAFFSLFGLHQIFLSLPFPPGEGILWEWFPIYNPFLFGMHFLVGTLIGAWYAWEEKRWPKVRLWKDFAVIALTAGLFYFLWEIREADDYAYSWPKWPFHFPAVALIVSLWLALVPTTKYLGKILDNRPFIWIATVSFSTYLFHMLVIFLLRTHVFTEFDLPLYRWFEFVGTAIVLSLLVGWIGYKTLEAPATKWKNGFYGWLEGRKKSPN